MFLLLNALWIGCKVRKNESRFLPYWLPVFHNGAIRGDKIALNCCIILCAACADCAVVWFLSCASQSWLGSKARRAAREAGFGLGVCALSPSLFPVRCSASAVSLSPRRCWALHRSQLWLTAPRLASRCTLLLSVSLRRSNYTHTAPVAWPHRSKQLRPHTSRRSGESALRPSAVQISSRVQPQQR